MTLSSEDVEQTIMHCLYEPEEVLDGKTPADAIMVEGVVRKFALHPGRVEESRQKIVEMLEQLPDSFMVSKGGGMSFLNMCVDRDGNQWGAHRSMEALIVLGIAVKRVAYCAPREMWQALPGGVPYIVVNDKE